MLKPETSLDLMRHCFPSWSDIRKRTGKSVGGGLLRAYAKEYGNMQKAIEDYQKIFFLVNYHGHEEEIPDYLYAATVGVHDGIKIDSIICKMTDDEETFLAHMNTTALQAGAYVLFHESILPKDTKFILYSVDGQQYSSDLVKIPIWNAFDEFAKFAGLERYDGETNKELEARTYAVFKNFPNPTGDGIKKAIINAVVPLAEIHPEEITIEPLNLETLDFSKKEAEDIYESFVQFNHDLFRTKVWNLDNWEHGFQKQGYIPHAWDKPMEVTQDGVGYNDSLKVSYLKDLDTTGLTDISVYAYKKDFETVKQYVEKNRVEDDISLKLSKYNDNIQPKKIEYAIHAYSVKKLDNPQGILVKAMRRQSGTMNVRLSDVVSESHGVDRIEHGYVDKDENYMLSFCPVGDFSTMTVSRCNLSDGNGTQGLLHPKDQYIMCGDSIVNRYVRAHIASVSDISWNDNVIDTPHGLTVGGKRSDGGFDVNIQGMENELVTIKTSCHEVDITNSPYVSGYNGFVLGKDSKSYVDSKKDSIGTVVIGGPDNPLMCNSFSFTFDHALPLEKQGTILVTITADGQEEKFSCSHATVIHREYDKRIPVQVVIQKYGEDAVAVRKFMMSSYDIEMSLTKDESHFSYLGHATRLPAVIDKDAYLHVHITPYTSSSPYVEYVHIGGSLKGASYDVTFSTNGMTRPRLDIETDCLVTLYRLDSQGMKYVVGTKDAYSTRDSYYNSGDEDGQLILDLSSFLSIEKTVPAVHKKYRDGEKLYINVAPGEIMDSIMVVGERVQTITTRSFAYYFLDNDIENWELYATYKNKGILAWNVKTKEFKRCFLYREDFDSHADSFSFVNLPDDVSVNYVYDNGTQKEVTSAALDNTFYRFDLSYDGCKESIAYNSVSTISDIMENVEIANTFAPSISLTQLYYYEVDPPAQKDDATSVVFMDTESTSAFGSSMKLRIRTVLPAANKKNWPLHVSRINNKVVLSSEIALDESVQIDGIWHELQEYLLEAPKGIEIHYELTDEYHEEIKVPESRISKLRYSRLQDVRIEGFPRDGYELQSEEGLIIWKTDNCVGRTLSVSYRVQRPAYLYYTKAYEEQLYKVVQYQNDAYKLLEEKLFRQKKDADKLLLSFQEQPDHVITKCSNPAFTTSVRDDIMTVIQIKDDERLAVHNGYIYDEGREYYYFNDKYQDQVERANSVEFHNVSHQRGDLLFHMRSKNFLPNSNMDTDCLDALCHMDFVKYPVPGISDFGHLTACESYNLWYTVNMDISLSQSLNGYGLHFKARKGIGYAAINITDYIRAEHEISVYADGNIVPSIVEERTVDGMPFLKSVFLDMGRQYSMTLEDGYYTYIVLSDPEPEARYYLLASGTEGHVDDLISQPLLSELSSRDAHKKNIDRMDMTIDEKLPKFFEMKLDFTSDGASYTDLVCGSDGRLSTSSSVEYGLTKIGEINLTDCSFEYADYKDGNLISIKDGAVIRTRPFYVKSSASAYAAYIKINEIIGGKYKGFGVRVYGSDYLNNGYTLIKEEEYTNLVEIKHDELKSYLYLELIADDGKVIHSVETYVRYAEIDGVNLVPEQKDSGTFISKVYDLGTVRSYRFDGADAEIDGEKGRTEFAVRGIRADKKDMVSTEWKTYREGREPIVLKDYQLVQFRVVVSGGDTSVKVHAFKIGVV